MSSKTSKSSKKPSKKDSSYQNAVIKRSAVPEPPVSERDLKNMWDTVRSADQLGRTILAIVPRQEVSTVKATIKQKSREKHGTLNSQVRVITPDDLGATINKLTQALGKPSKHSQPALSILVSYSIARIGYNVPKVFKSFAIDVFKGSPSSYRLCISFDSTYSDAYTAAWTAQRRSLLDRQKFSQSACCYYNPAENLDLAQRMLTPVQDEPDCSAEDMEKMEFTIKDFVQTVAVGNNSAGNPVPQVSAATAAAPAPQPSADGSESWFQKWKGVIATVIGLGAGVGGAMATVKITAAGLYVSGPLGLSIAAGFVHGSMFAGAAAFGTGVGLGAAAMVYFIPWDVFFAYLKQKLWRIWESVVEAVKWVLNKMRELASTFVQQVKLAVANSLAGHKAGPFMR